MESKGRRMVEPPGGELCSYVSSRVRCASVGLSRGSDCAAVQYIPSLSHCCVLSAHDFHGDGWVDEAELWRKQCDP